MNLTFLSSHKEEIFLVFVEVEAHTAGKTVYKWLLLTVSKFLLLVDDELQLDDLLRLKLVLHQVPESDASIRRDRVEAKVLALLIVLPADLPDGIGVLVRSNC